MDLLTEIAILVLAAFVGFEVISKVPISSRPPSTTIPWIAFVPDISGVCSVLGTLEITAGACVTRPKEAA